MNKTYNRHETIGNRRIYTAPNQKVIKVIKTNKAEYNNALEYALYALTPNTFKIWVYLINNQPDYLLALSRIEVMEVCNIGSKDTYSKCVKELIDKGYMRRFKDGSNHYYLYEFPERDNTDNDNLTTSDCEDCIKYVS